MRHFALGLLLCSVVLAGCSSGSPPPQQSPPRSAQARRTARAQPAVTPATGLHIFEPIRYRPEGRRDPFNSLVEPPSEETAVDVGGYKLSGIVWQQNQFFALLETPDGLGHILKVDDRLGPGARVKEITKDAVLIEMTGRQVTGRPGARMIRLELEKKEGR